MTSIQDILACTSYVPSARGTRAGGGKSKPPLFTATLALPFSFPAGIHQQVEKMKMWRGVGLPLPLHFAPVKNVDFHDAYMFHGATANVAIEAGSGQCFLAFGLLLEF